MSNLKKFKKNIDKYIKEAKTDINVKIDKPPSILEIQNTVYGTVGNLSVLSGKAKGGKSFAHTMFVTAFLDPNNRVHKGWETKQKYKSVIIFDTEQSPYHVSLMSSRIVRKLNSKHKTKFLNVYGLRPYTPEQRLILIKHIIYKAENLSLVVIDGIADLVSNGYNDEADSIMIASKLLKWTKELNIHIITIIHQNKADNNTKGHLGAQLMQKAETVLDVAKLSNCKGYFTITPNASRGIDIDNIVFQIDEYGIPVLADEPENDILIRKKYPRDFDYEYKLQLVNKAFENKKELFRNDLSDLLKHYLSEDGYKIGNSILRDWITYFKVEKMIKQKSERKPYKLNA